MKAEIIKVSVKSSNWAKKSGSSDLSVVKFKNENHKLYHFPKIIVH